VRGYLWTALIATLMMLMLYRRFKFIGRGHRVRPWRMLLRMAIWTLLATSLLLLPWVSLPLLLGALALGVGLGVYSLSTTKFERGERGLTVKPNSYVGTVIFVLFAARITWRLIDRFVNDRPFFRRFADPDSAMATPPEQTPIAFILLFIVIGYSLCYSVGVLIRARSTPQTA
jgi:hypothetical protein